MTNLLRLPPQDKDGHFHMVVESPAGSRVKYEFDPELRAFKFDRPLPIGVAYPFDWGFIAGTKAEDGDPLDAMVLNDIPSYPGLVIPCRMIGVVLLTQMAESGKGRERNDRMIVVPAEDPRFAKIKDARDLPGRTRKEIEHFFLIADFLEDKAAKVEGWDGAKAAIGEAIKAIKRYQKSSP